MNLKNFFDAHPDVDCLHVVNGMPFVDKNHATNYAAECGKDLETVFRQPANEAEVAPPKAETTANETEVAGANSHATGGDIVIDLPGFREAGEGAADSDSQGSASVAEAKPKAVKPKPAGKAKK